MSEAANNMIELIFGASKAQLISCAIKLEIVEHLSVKPMAANELSTLTNTKPELLYRFLRALASMEVLKESSDAIFTVTEFGMTLDSRSETSVRNTVLMEMEYSAKVISKLDHTLRTGEVAFDNYYGISYFDFLRKNEEVGKIFDKSMSEMAIACRYDLLVTEYDYSPFNHIVDVGGGNGHFLISVLEKTPNAKGTLFDVESCIEAAKIKISKSTVCDRCTTVAGSFFNTIPGNADCYILQRILHDWNDTNALKILFNIKKQMKPSSKLLFIEEVISHKDSNVNKLYDIIMLAYFGGKTRTIEEIESLFSKANLKLERSKEIKQCDMFIMQFTSV